MGINVETPVIQQNTGLIKAAYAGGELLKQAMDNSTYFIRDKVRELGFARKIIEPIFVTSADLDRVPNNEQPAIILEKDIESKGMTVPFRGQGEQRYWEREDMVINFQKIESERINKSKFEMMTSKTPYTEVLKKRIVEEVQKVEDETLMNGLNTIVEKAEETAPGTQYQELEGGLNKTNIKILIQMLSRLKMIPPTGPKPKILMTQNLKLELIELGMIEIGDSNVGKYWNEGVVGVDKLFNIPVVSTIKNDLVKDDEVFIIAPQDYFGRYFILQDHTMVIETKADMMNMYTYAAMGMGFVNTKGVCKIKLS